MTKAGDTTSRPLKLAKFQDLEAEFRQRGADRAFLEQLVGELSVRSTKSAARLREEAERSLSDLLNQGQAPRPAAADRTPRSRPSPSGASKPATSTPSPPRSASRTAQPLDNAPNAILSAWTALEVLSPQSFVRPEDLAPSDRNEASRAVARLDRGLPWEGAGEKSKPKHQLYYQLVLGSVELAPALKQLIELYGDSRVERQAMRGEAALAVVMLDRAGRPVEDTPVSVSSFGWGLARAL